MGLLPLLRPTGLTADQIFSVFVFEFIYTARLWSQALQNATARFPAMRESWLSRTGLSDFDRGGGMIVAANCVGQLCLWRSVGDCRSATRGRQADCGRRAAGPFCAASSTAATT
jgi:hypothetical protein